MIQLKDFRLDANEILYYYPEAYGAEDSQKFNVVIVWKVDKDDLEIACEDEDEVDAILRELSYRLDGRTHA